MKIKLTIGQEVRVTHPAYYHCNTITVELWKGFHFLIADPARPMTATRRAAREKAVPVTSGTEVEIDGNDYRIRLLSARDCALQLEAIPKPTPGPGLKFGDENPLKKKRRRKRPL